LIGTTKYRITAATTALSALVIVATVAIGLTGWPLPRAEASTLPEAEQVLGVDADTAVALAPEASIDSKFEAATASATPVAVSLIAPTTKRVAELVPKRNYPLARHLGGSSIIRGKWRKARASWYGPGLYGNGMAGGGKLKRNSMVVAHRSLPFGTRILFKYKGRSVIAVVKDRGPFVAGRKFDLGPGTAKALHFNGVGKVRYRILR